MSLVKRDKKDKKKEENLIEEGMFLIVVPLLFQIDMREYLHDEKCLVWREERGHIYTIYGVRTLFPWEMELMNAAYPHITCHVSLQSSVYPCSHYSLEHHIWHDRVRPRKIFRNRIIADLPCSK